MTLRELLLRHDRDLRRYLERRAGWLVRFETPEDLAQGLHLRALEQEAHFVYQGREPFFAWVHTLMDQHLAARRKHWMALKRRPRALLRLTEGGTGRAAVDPADTATGPSTFADRRERLALAVKAMAVLLPRDQELVRCATDGLTTEEIASRLDLTPESARRARNRALERYREAYALLAARRR